MNAFASIPEAIKELRRGNMLIVVDSPRRENQGDVIFPSDTATTKKVNFLIQECRGLVCTAITTEKAKQLEIPLMVDPSKNTEKLKCNFTISVDAKAVTSFGISASDRALTIKTLANSSATVRDFDRPGHIFPIIAKDGGVLERNGHTEATVELSRLAGFQPLGVLCEVLRDDGEVARLPDLTRFSKKFNLKMITIDDLIAYRTMHPQPMMAKNSLVVKQSSSSLPTKYGTFKIAIYKSLKDDREHTVLSLGDIHKQPVLIRIHSQCLTGDTLFSLRCDCQEQLHQSMQQIEQKGSGAILYLNQEGRGIGLANKIKAYALQEKGLDTVEANHALGFPSDLREYEVAADILHDLGITRISLLTNNPDKIAQLTMYGIHVDKHISLEVNPQQYNKQYLKTKKQKLNHQLENM